MKKEIVVNRSTEECRVAILEDGNLLDIFIERRESKKIVGNIYLGKVENILPGISSAFVDIGLEKNAYLFVDDVITNKSKEKNIEKMLSKGQDIIVQVDKEPIGTKGAKVTMDISLPGRFLVYMPYSHQLGVSKNIKKEEDRNRLKRIINDIRPKNGGIIIRTEAEGASEKELRREMKYLLRLWDSIVFHSKQVKSPSLLHRDLGVVFQTVRDYFNEKVSMFIVDSETEYKEVKEFVEIVSPELIDRISLYKGKTPIFKAFGIEKEIKKLYSNRVDLPSGGSIIIQEAESLCAVDVNTGRYTGDKSQEETVTQTNIEAAREIARQLRLRNIGGIIVIDFIDMKKQKNRQRVLEVLKESFKGDKAKVNILPITRLGLIEMTRERKRESFFSLMGETCPMCHGVGAVTSKESLFIQVCNELQQLKISKGLIRIRLRLNPGVYGYFKERINRLSEICNAKIDIQMASDVDWDDFQIIIE